MKKLNAKRLTLICISVIIVVLLALLIWYCLIFPNTDTYPQKIECVIGEIVEYDSLKTDFAFVDNCEVENKPIIEMTSLREYSSDDLVREYEENHRFEFEDFSSYTKFKSNQEELNIFEVELIIANHHKSQHLINVEWVSEATNDIVVADCDIMDDFSSVESMKESVYSVVVLTTQNNLSTEQLKQLLSETNLKLKYRLCSSNRLWGSVSNEYSEQLF
ncbi:MAG: hypothetical protein IJN78_05860 [Clostridia bacterium]|nr:hypothetical protein [Clostridia bacterium]